MRYKQVLLGMQAVLWTCVATTSFTGCGVGRARYGVREEHAGAGIVRYLVRD